MTKNENNIKEGKQPKASTAADNKQDKEQKADDTAKKQNARKKADADEELSLKAVIEKTATEEEAPQSSRLSLRKILGGDILSAAIIRRQVWLMLLIAVFMVIYVANRYSCQQDIIEIDRLRQQLTDAKYKALSSQSELTELSRESNVLEMLKNNNDSTLKIASQPPYFIEIPNER